MRWKLLLFASLLAAVVGAGLPLIIILWYGESAHRLNSPDMFVLGTFVIPLIAMAAASFFVYRHTARRRSLQAMLTALVSGFLVITTLIAGALLLDRRLPRQPPARHDRDITQDFSSKSRIV